MANKEKKQKVKKTPKQKFIKFLKILAIIICVIAILCGICAIISAVGIKSNRDFINNLEPVKYESQLVPEKDDNGYYTFVTDYNLKVMQLTDVHIGAGFLSIHKDNMALNAVAAMINEEKPDLVIVTGDIAYPVPFQAGTFNNKNSAKLFADLMEELGVYWCLAFGNHDTEAYSYYSREDISAVYESGDYPHCLYQSGPEDVDGCGNYPVLVKNSVGEITQALIMLDSHSYVDNDYFGIMWKYDCIHENQITWYENMLSDLQAQNNGVMPKSLCFFHIPVPEYKTAWFDYADNDMQDTADTKFIYGKAGEKDSVVYTSEHNYGFFDKANELGSTKGMFCGHDHLNNFALDYKGVKLAYSYSIDYLAYAGIMNFGLQRGCTIIDVKPDGTFDAQLENYYQDKYTPTNEKESVDLDNWMNDVD